MCGIMGYVGAKNSSKLLIEGLKRLEYRGYDSAGITLISEGKITTARCKGKISELEKKVSNGTYLGKTGIGHTRWATHGKPSDENAHPHSSQHVVVVHNGIIENHVELRAKLISRGYEFSSETDTEVIPLLIEDYYGKLKSFEKAVRAAINDLEGSFALCMISSWEPDKIIVAKNSSPLIIGVGNDENFVASDIPAILTHTRDVVILDDGELAVITREGYSISDFKGTEIKRDHKRINWTAVMAEKEGYQHFMLKEIFEQPRAIIDTFRGRVLEREGNVNIDGIELEENFVKGLRKVLIVACGTSFHAALVGKIMIESLSRICVDVELASEFRYSDPIVDKHDLLITISQSGETIDTLGALEEAKGKGVKSIAICNVVDSSIARKSDNVVYTHAGPEIGVASTKAFTTQLTALFLFAIYLGRKKEKLAADDARKLLHELALVPQKVEDCLKLDKSIKELSKKYFKSENFFYLGRSIHFPIALEGALKLKEISYIHAEGYPGGEIKHGPIALIDEGVPVLVIAPPGHTRDKMLSNLEEVKTRGARTILLTEKTRQNDSLEVNDIIYVPDTHRLLQPIIEVVPLQMLAYHIAVLRGTDVDQPRNLAKSVTVE